MARPILDDIELQQVQEIEIDGDQALVRHDVPALEGDFFQGLGRRAMRITLNGVLTGHEVGEALANLWEKFRAAEPIPFVADIATATQVSQVIIKDMTVRDLAGKPERFEYTFTLMEFIPPPAVTAEPPPEIERPDNPDEEIDEGVGTLIVEVIVEGQPAYDFSRVTVNVTGSQQDGTQLTRTLTNRSDNKWTEENFPAGSYTAEAVAAEDNMRGNANVNLAPGETKEVTITLRAGAVVAKMFVVHFWFDKSFVEPCMRAVLRQIAEYARTHSDEKLVIVGHTDMVGDRPPVEPLYNQSLSERRGRSVYAYLTYGRDQANAVAEWEQLRRARTTGVRLSNNDTWGTRQYQYILHDLGYYPGNVDGNHGTETDAGVRRYQGDKGLSVDGVVGDDTWAALINDYLGQDNLAVPESQFLPNAADGCNDGILKWIGCGELDPVRETKDAWRPNRRTELLFVRDSSLPARVRKPDTFDLAPPLATTWCLGDDTTRTRGCFVQPHLVRKETCGTPVRDPWTRTRAEPGDVNVRGSIHFEDGTPAANIEYILIAPDGEYMDGERPSGANRGRPRYGHTDSNGEFSYSNTKGIGVYTFEVKGPYIARLQGQSLDDAKGSVVCKRLESGDSFDVVIIGKEVAAVQPSITIAQSTVIVKKTYTNPARRPVILRATPAFTGSGTLTRSSDRIHFFTALTGGTEITFNGVDNVFTNAQLTAGHTIYAEGAQASAALNDVELTLTLTVNGQGGRSTTERMTAVELTLDICATRPAPGVAPVPLPQPPAAVPPAGTATDKWYLGRFVQARDPSNTHERAMLIVRQAQPTTFAGELVLRPFDARVEIFTDEIPAVGQSPVTTPHNIPNSGINASGERFFVQGVSVSAAARDTGFQLGIRDLEADGDRVAITVVQLDMIDEAVANAPAITFSRFGIWDNAYHPTGHPQAGDVRNGVAEADNFIGADTRKFHFRIRDASVTSGQQDVDWKTLRADRTDDDAPVSQVLTLLETAAGSQVFVSRAVMLVTDDTDHDFQTNSGLSPPHPDAGLRNSGQSNHRTRRAGIDGFVRGEYSPQANVRLHLTLPVFNRNPDERRRVNARVIRYINPADATYTAAGAAYIAGQFEHANLRWNQVGIQIDRAATIDRQIPAAALNAGRYAGSANNAFEQAALADLIPFTPDNTITVVFVHKTGGNAYVTVAQRNPIPLPTGGTLTLGERYFIFINTTINLNGDTLAHEFHHALFNRFDDAVDRQFFTFNTNPSSSYGIALPDVRVRRRIHNLYTPNPNNDPNNDNVINWARRTRTARFPIAGNVAPAATATTGNTITQNF